MPPKRKLPISARGAITGCHDLDVEADPFTRSGPYLTKRFGFDQ